MALFLSIDTAGEPEIGAPAPDRLVSGNPTFRTWNAEEAEGGLYAGIWEATPGKWRIAATPITRWPELPQAST